MVKTNGWVRGVLAAALLALAAQPAAAQCGGDCNGDGTVAINELITGVNIALGSAAVSTCGSFDVNGNDGVEINELVLAVNAALEGCPAAACTPQPGGRCVEIAPGPDAQDEILGALIEAQPKDTIFLRAGTYALDQQLSLQVNDVTLRGEGQDRTILSFSGQTSGGEGLLVQADGFTAEDIGFEDSPGDLLKVEGGVGVTLRRVRAEWTRGPSIENGAYGLYPVQCRDVLIEDSIVKGARDAGVYVGQSRNIVVRRNHVEGNVAGIEIENSTDADVTENVATGNAGGILVFNLPGPPVQDGRRTRVFHNQIFENNIVNFAIPGSSVSGVPSGTGTMVLANDQVELFGNDFRDNNTTDVAVIGYETARLFGQAPATNPNFDPYSETVFIHDNTYSGSGTQPAELLEILVNLLGSPLPNILYDGSVNPARLQDGAVPAGLRLCVQETGATFANLDVPNSFANVSTDLATVDCTHDALSPVVIGTARLVEIAPGPNAEEEILTALLEAQPGDDILLKAGTYEITQPLSLTVDHVRVRGEGMDSTVLSFANLSGGGEGLLVQGDDFTIEDIGLEDTPQNDILKAIGVDGITIRRVRAEWTNGPDMENGAYALYPVQCKDVLIEDCVVRGASDAGVYVGQSRNIIVRRNQVEYNVAGIEIENSTGADVYENVATLNTGGILVFNLPGLPVYGARTRVHDNQVFRNNTPNFAHGGAVGAVPTGTGIFVLANDQVEIFGNSLRENDTNAISVISYNTAQFFGLAAPTDPAFDPFSESIYVLDNTYDGGGTDPDLGDLEDILVGLVGGLPLPQIVYDGDVDPAKLVDGALPDALRTCVQDSGTFVDLNVPAIVAGEPMVSKDPTPFDCSLARLTPVSIPGVQ